MLSGKATVKRIPHHVAGRIEKLEQIILSRQLIPVVKNSRNCSVISRNLPKTHCSALTSFPAVPSEVVFALSELFRIIDIRSGHERMAARPISCHTFYGVTGSYPRLLYIPETISKYKAAALQEKELVDEASMVMRRMKANTITTRKRAAHE